MTQKILFVDDDEAILRSYRRLIGCDFDIDIAIGGRQGLELLNKNEPSSNFLSSPEISLFVKCLMGYLERMAFP